MRLSYVAAVAVALLALTFGSPAGAVPKTPTKSEQAVIDKLDKELTQHQLKQATFAALKVAKQVYDLTKKGWGDDAPQTLRIAQTLAGLLTQTGDYAGAVAMYKEMLATTERQHGVDSREAMYALMPLIGPYWAQNRLDDLEPIYLRILTMSKKLDGERSAQYAGNLMQYGTLLNQRNEYSAALRLYEQAYKIQEAAAASKDDLSLTGPLQALAAGYWQANQKQKAIALYDRVLAIVDKSASGNVQLIAGTYWGVAAQYHYGGRDDLAAPLTKKVVDLFTKEVARLEKTKPDDPMLSAMLGQLGYQYRQAGDLAKADEMLTRSVALDEKRGNSYSGWLGSLAEIKRAEGKPKEALVLLEKAQAQLTKISPMSSTIYNTQIAEVLRELGDYPRAEKLMLGYLANLAKTYGKRHPIYGMSQLTLAHNYMASGKLAQAEVVLQDSLEIAERELSLVLKTGTETDHAVYFGKNNYQLDMALNFQLDYAPKSASAARLGLTTLLRRKGRVLDAAAANLATIRSKLSPDDKKLLDDLASARATLAKLTVAGPSATGDADYAKEVARLEDQVVKLEITVGKKSTAYRAVTQTIDLPSVQRLIPKDAKLVEIVNFQPGDPKGPYVINPVPKPRKYAAYVVGAKGDPVLIDLGDAAAIDTAIEKFRKAVADPANKKVVDLGHDLYTLTMAKLAPALGGATSVLLAPDGALNVVPFSALVDDQQQFLIKTYTFTYLTSGRDLLRLNIKTKAQGGGVIFADPSFDAGGPAPAAKPGDAAGDGTRGRRSSDLASLMWPPLPGTGQEADEVTKRMTGLKLYRGTEATEAAVKSVHGPRILHLATHGFFLPDEPPPPPKDADLRSAPGAPMPVASYENPLLRSGLAFAGANKLVSGDDDGILTAMEASGLDLQGTKLVVLSACETGVGKVTNGDGVYGLRRALVIAGAESLVMSLWQVDDVATKDLMAGYYARLKAGKGRSTALRDIQLELAGRKDYAHPFYWASFLPAGDNAPL
ncbi:MAG: CHAT domain-containing protein [Myxococcales bacterium]|nr:CHAT domain-containing protein [Myxococcales bacterium]